MARFGAQLAALLLLLLAVAPSRGTKLQVSRGAPAAAARGPAVRSCWLQPLPAVPGQPRRNRRRPPLAPSLCSRFPTALFLVRPQWNVTGDYVNYPFGSPYPPYVIRTTEGNDPDRFVLVSGGGGNGGQWVLTAYEADSGTQAWTATVAAPDPANAGLTTLTSGLPHWQQLNSSLGLLFMQLGKSVVALDAATGQQRWQHATYNASTPKITGYRCAAQRREAAWDAPGA